MTRIRRDLVAPDVDEARLRQASTCAVLEGFLGEELCLEARRRSGDAPSWPSWLPEMWAIVDELGLRDEALALIAEADARRLAQRAEMVARANRARGVAA